MSARCYAVVWINHNAAEVFRIDAIEESKLVVNSHTSQQSLHHGGHAGGGEDHPDHPVDTEYFARIASALNHVGGILLAGPGEARFEFARYLGAARPDLAAHVHEFDTPGHPGDAALVALARDQFHLVRPPRASRTPVTDMNSATWASGSSHGVLITAPSIAAFKHGGLAAPADRGVTHA